MPRHDSRTTTLLQGNFPEVVKLIFQHILQLWHQISVFSTADRLQSSMLTAEWIVLYFLQSIVDVIFY